ncbi:MAG: hypothetical protein M0R06_15480 [Sphaerochaeta sp.]|nr:hypothetical protein [Sphaerochaeta sp.]
MTMASRGRSISTGRATKESREERDRFSARLRVYRLRVVAGPPGYEFGDEYEEVLDPERYEKYFPVRTCAPTKEGVS